MSKKLDLQSCTTDIHDIEYLVCHVGLLWRRLLNAKIKSLGFSGTEKRVLFCIAHNPGLTQVQIATLLDLEPQNLMRSLDKLEKQHLIEKHADQNDRRIKCLSIKPDAKKIVAQIKAISDGIKPQILSGIDTKDIQFAVRQLGQMRENIIDLLEKVEK